MNEFGIHTFPWSETCRKTVSRLVPGTGFAIGLAGLSAEDAQRHLETRESAVREDADGMRRVQSRFHLEGLDIETCHTLFPGGRAVAFSGRVRNVGDRPSPALQSLQPVSLDLTLAREERLFAYTVTGGRCDSAYPPLDFGFSIKPHELVAWQANHDSATWADGGMTWNGFTVGRELPYHLVQFGKKGGGLFFALEWPGDWHSNIARAAGGEGLQCRSGLTGLDLVLAPGESLPLPGALIGFYEGDWIEGGNALRRVIRDHYTPDLDGRPVVPPVFYDHWFALGQNCTEPLMREQAAVAARVGCEYFVQDAGWYKGSPMESGSHFQGTGNWDQVQRDKYPDGLKPLAEFVGARNMGFGLWVEPTRCDRESDLAKAHPEWIVFDPAGSRLNNMVNFGNPEARAWMTATFDRLIRENNVRWLRFDVGAGIEDYPEPAGRRGLLKLRHYEGFMAFWDHLGREHPAVVFEGCSNGGRRMDLACLKRSHTFWCNDHTEHPDVVRSDLRMNLILPANYLNHVVCLKNPASDYPDYAYHCLMGGTWGFTEKLSEWPEMRLAEARRHADVFKGFRHLLMKDFAPLFPYPLTLDDWDGWQWHDPESGEGVVIIFRCLGEETVCSPTIRWLDAEATYVFSDPYTGERQDWPSTLLCKQGLPVHLAAPRSSLVRTYKIRSTENS